MTSKKRRKSREWMQKERALTEATVYEAQTRSYNRGAADERQKLTRMIPRDDVDGCVYPSGKIESPIMKVYTVGLDERRLATPQELYGSDNIRRYARLDVPMDTLRAVQYALVLSDGTKVIWWGWELGR